VRCLIYTTDPFFKKDLPMVASWLMETPGRGEVVFDVQKVTAPRTIPTVVDADGDNRPQWEWFEKRFVKGLSPKYDAVGFHFTSKEKKRWKISPKVNGTYHRNSDDILDLWLCADKGEKAKHYEYSQFARILVHEILHGDIHWTNSERELVHLWDYKYHDIHSLPKLLSYRNWNVLVKIKELLTNFLDNAKSGHS
jgi:hypothetical protein